MIVLVALLNNALSGGLFYYNNHTGINISFQLNYAGILSTGYSLVMMIVLVGLLINAADNGFCSVTTIFLLFVAGVFVISAFLHPRVSLSSLQK